MVSHRLLVRGGFVRQIAAGVYTFMPLGWRVIRRIESIMREEMDRIGGQEMYMPVLAPAELWQETGRWYEIGPELVRFKDRTERDFVLAMTHEETITAIARNEIRSYRQLPFMSYHIQTKVRDEARPRGGLVRLREFIMKDAYSFHPDASDLDAFYPEIYQAYHNIFRRCGLEVIAVEADPGMMGGTGSHEFMVVSEAGEDALVTCGKCGYAANIEKAQAAKRPAMVLAEEDQRPIEEVSTPGIKTIDSLVEFFNLPPERFLKTVVYTMEGSLILVVIRGDLDINEAKLARVLRSADLRLADEENLRAAGIVAGFVSPVGLDGVRVVLDDSVSRNNFIAGANKPDTHLRNVRFPRDFRAELVADIAMARAGDPCLHCGSPLQVGRGIEVGHTFKLGTKYSAAMKATYLRSNGQEATIVMGSYGIGLDRLLAAIVEQNHDEFGIIWPPSVAPYGIYLCALGMDNPQVAAEAERVYTQLMSAGYKVLFDDRLESPGVKFNDADLIGIPLRLTVSQRTLKRSSVEVRWRRTRQEKSINLENLAETMLTDVLPRNRC